MKSKKYLAWVKSLPCCHCRAPADDAHHIIGVGMGKMGGKSSDLHAMALCRPCHQQVHADGGGLWPQTRWMCETQLKAVEQGMIKL